VDLCPVSSFTAGLGVLLLIVLVSMWGLLRLLSPDRPTGEISREATIETERQLQQLRQREEEILTGYGWVDKDKDIVRIPIDRAIEIMLKKDNKGVEEDE